MKNIFRNVQLHRVDFVKIVLVFLAIGAFVLAGIVYNNAQALKARQTRQAQQSVANHTETLNEIASAVTQIKQNNQTNHDTTVRYIQCLAQLIVDDSQGMRITQVDLNDCSAISGLAVTSTASAATSNKTTSAPAPAPAASQPATASTSTTSGTAAISTAPKPTPTPNLLHKVLNFVGL